MAKIVIGCRLPHGLTISHPSNREFKATINGLHSAKEKGATQVTTEIDAELWAAWKAAYPDYQPLKSGAIFEAKNEDTAVAKGRELRKEKTGFEPLAPEAGGVKRAEK